MEVICSSQAAEQLHCVTVSCEPPREGRGKRWHKPEQEVLLGLCSPSRAQIILPKLRVLNGDAGGGGGGDTLVPDFMAHVTVCV